MRETRAHAIHAHVLAALRHSGITDGAFANDVAALYAARTPLEARSIQFHQWHPGLDATTVQRANAQLLFRMLRPDGPSRMPVELEESVVLALPQPYLADCQRELAGRMGLLAADLPAPVDAPLAAHLNSPVELMRRAAVAVERIAPMLEDGRIGPEDAAHFTAALSALNDVAGACVTLNAQIHQAMQEPPANVTRMRRTQDAG